MPASECERILVRGQPPPPRIAFVRVATDSGDFRKFAAGPFDVLTYAGLCAEAGNVWQQRGDARFASARKGGAAFAKLDTPLGSVCVGTGYG